MPKQGEQSLEAYGFTASVRNTGQTPGRRFRIMAEIFVREHLEKGGHKDHLRHTFTSSYYSGPQAGAERTLSVGNLPTVMAIHKAVALDNETNTMRVLIGVVGVLEYETVFDEHRAVDFEFATDGYRIGDYIKRRRTDNGPKSIDLQQSSVGFGRPGEPEEIDD
ncbi:hypothetical protein [Haematobacter massiliensis]|uniref:hypothetical protein n=1 Tax=Haematobacter massiliensis TaxID=195105 RepID=UPI00103FD7CC|nr:hypothetical protein [Haematobacter massiliensis]QBJ24903.1 hypothetical protein HmaOT1_12005 [Haematobacter massiliensis]